MPLERRAPGQLHVEAGEVALGRLAVDHAVSAQFQEQLHEGFALPCSR